MGWLIRLLGMIVAIGVFTGIVAGSWGVAAWVAPLLGLGDNVNIKMLLMVVISVAAIGLLVAIVKNAPEAIEARKDTQAFRGQARASRAEAKASSKREFTRSRLRGHLDEALETYMETNEKTEFLRLLREQLANVPKWNAKDCLLDTAQEVFELRRSAEIALKAGVPQNITTEIAAKAQTVAEVLGGRTNRLTAVAAQNFESQALHQALQRETDKLHQLLDAIRQAREGLAVLTLRDERDRDFEKLHDDLRKIGMVARELGEESEIAL